jgi:hypothetical protein
LMFYQQKVQLQVSTPALRHQDPVTPIQSQL